MTFLTLNLPRFIKTSKIKIRLNFILIERDDAQKNLEQSATISLEDDCAIVIGKWRECDK